jgi:hypothetical protein
LAQERIGKKQQFVVAHTLRQKEIPALLASWITNTPSVKMSANQKKKSLSLCILIQT